MELFDTRGRGDARPRAEPRARSRTRSLVWLTALMLASASPVQAGPSRPFKASLDAQHRIGRLGHCPGVDGQPGPGATFTGTGHATHLGAVELHSEHCITIRTDKPDKPIFVFDGRMRMMAANGDLLQADYAGQFIPGSNGVYTFEGHYDITGGTGRFEDGEGTGMLFGTVQGEFPIQSQGVTLSAQGRISY